MTHNGAQHTQIGSRSAQTENIEVKATRHAYHRPETTQQTNSRTTGWQVKCARAILSLRAYRRRSPLARFNPGRPRPPQPPHPEGTINDTALDPHGSISLVQPQPDLCNPLPIHAPPRSRADKGISTTRYRPPAFIVNYRSPPTAPNRITNQLREHMVPPLDLYFRTADLG